MSTWHNLASPRKKVSVNNCPDQVSLWTCLWRLFDYVNLCRKTHWAAPLPRQGSLDWVSLENKLSTEKHACAHPSLLLSMDITTCFEFLPWLPSWDGLGPRIVNWNKHFPITCFLSGYLSQQRETRISVICEIWDCIPLQSRAEILPVAKILLFL